MHTSVKKVTKKTLLKIYLMIYACLCILVDLYDISILGPKAILSMFNWNKLHITIQNLLHLPIDLKRLPPIL